MRIAMIPCSHADIHPNNSFHLARALVFYQLGKNSISESFLFPQLLLGLVEANEQSM